MKLPANIGMSMKRTKKDFQVDFFRAGGKGGQNQNKRDTGVRITDKITGLSAEGREFASQNQNKEAAFRRLVDKMISYYINLHRVNIPVEDEAKFTYKPGEDLFVNHQTGDKMSYKKRMKGEL